MSDLSGVLLLFNSSDVKQNLLLSSNISDVLLFYVSDVQQNLLLSSNVSEVLLALASCALIWNILAYREAAIKVIKHPQTNIWL